MDHATNAKTLPHIILGCMCILVFTEVECDVYARSAPRECFYQNLFAYGIDDSSSNIIFPRVCSFSL